MTDGELVEIGTVSSDTGVLVIVDPDALDPTSEAWQKIVDHGGLLGNFAGVPELPGNATGMLVESGPGRQTVYAGFCRGGTRLCCVTVEFHDGPGCDEPLDDTE